MKEEIKALKETWSSISRQHFSAGAGCGCGFGGLILQAADFEIDVVEFVINEAKRVKNNAVLAFIDATSKRGRDNYSLKSLFKALEEPLKEEPLKEERLKIEMNDASFIVSNLAKTINQISSAHSTGRFICD